MDEELATAQLRENRLSYSAHGMGYARNREGINQTFQLIPALPSA